MFCDRGNEGMAQNREIPRLCRGGSQSLTAPGVAMPTPAREPLKASREGADMDDSQSLTTAGSLDL